MLLSGAAMRNGNRRHCPCANGRVLACTVAACLLLAGLAATTAQAGLISFEDVTVEQTDVGGGALIWAVPISEGRYGSQGVRLSSIGGAEMWVARLDYTSSPPNALYASSDSGASPDSRIVVDFISTSGSGLPAPIREVSFQVVDDPADPRTPGVWAAAIYGESGEALDTSVGTGSSAVHFVRPISEIHRLVFIPSFEGEAIDDLVVTGPANEAPSAAEDAYAIRQGWTLQVDAPGVLANDTDPEAQPLRVVLIAGPFQGQLRLEADGSFLYTPIPGFSGSDRFFYRAKDESVSSPVAMVDLWVAPLRRLPGDCDGDGCVTVLDVIQLVQAFATTEGDPGWNELADLDGSGVVDVADLTLQYARFGQMLVDGDCNYDGVVTEADYDLLAAALGSQPGDPAWDPWLDLNGDNRIDQIDLDFVASRM